MTREYFDRLKRLALARIEEITGEVTADEVRRLEDDLVLYTKPKVFTGRDGLEVRHDKEFETMCLTITKETGRDAKGMTVLEYYNAYEYLREKARKEQNKAR